MKIVFFAIALIVLAGSANATDLAAAHSICEQHRNLHQIRPVPGRVPDAPYEPAFMSQCMAVNDAIRAQSGAESNAKTSSDLDALKAVAPSQ